MDLAQLRKDCFAHTQRALQHAITPDQLIIQANNTVHDLHKITNLLAKRMREWSGGWLPELDHEFRDHEHFIDKLVNGQKETSSIGTKIPTLDQQRIEDSAKQVHALYAWKQELMQYIEARLKEIMPNTLALCGAAIAADLLSHAGSLEHLANLPSGTIQLLGAETALFRHLRNKKHRPPKHGTIFNHSLIQRARREDRGRAARALADKIAIAVKVDRFKGEPCGAALKKDLEKRFGQKPEGSR